MSISCHQKKNSVLFNAKCYLFLVRMFDVQEGIGVKNIIDLVRKEIRGVFRTKNPTKDQIRKYKRREKE